MVEAVGARDALLGREVRWAEGRGVGAGIDGRGRLVVSVRGESWPGVLGRTFADVAAGELLVYEDSSGRLAVAVNQGSAVQRLGISVGDELRIATE